MAYNRLGDGPHYGHEDENYQSPPQRYQSPAYNDNTYPRPMEQAPAPQHGYQLQDNPHHLEIPMGPGPGTPGDRLQGQPTYSVENMQGTYGHNEAYEADYMQHGTGEYAVDPYAHHDAHYNQNQYPSPQEERPLHQTYSQEGQYWHEDPDTRPILQSGTAYGPDPVESAPAYSDEARPVTTPPAAPTPMIRRWKTVKEIKLFNGNLVLDCPVPPRLLNQVQHADPPERDEFTHMRYSAATCDPANFYEERFTLRQKLFAKPRHTELFIVVTMYNEDEVLFARTMIGVIKNIEYMNSRTSSKTWGKDAWKKIVVCVVSDGRMKINPRTRAVLAALGVYQDGIAKNQVNGKDVTGHIYEYTTQMTMELKKDVVSVKRGNTPVQMLFCLKEQNQKKINSHRWFFQAFGTVLDPNICVLIDAGTKPGRDSIYLLWKAFDREPMCAGACGEIKAMLEHGKQLWRPLVATQNFEYKMSNILDKPMESAFGFISVLPGAFSAYRYVALQNDKTGTGPLEKYFLGEKLHGAGAGIFKANMYLAEDRILCFELVTKRNCAWILHYVKSASGETDVPTEMSDFILQRRRWLNGSFFAAVYAIANAMMVFRSSHSFMRKVMFLFEFFYQTINMIFAWFAIGNFFLVFRILTFSLGDKDLLSTTGNVLAIIFEWFYLGVLISCFVLALGNRPQGSNKFYMSMVYFWVLIMAYLIFASIFITVRSIQNQLKEKTFSVGELFGNPVFFTLIVSMASTYLLWFVASFLFLDPWHMFTCLIQYLLMTPSYINILNVYAFCNTHDVSWGTKGAVKMDDLGAVSTKPGGKVEVSIPTDDADLNTQYERELAAFRTKFVEPKKAPDPAAKQEDYYKGFRSAVVLVWMFTNLALSAVVLQNGGLQVAIGKNEDKDKEANDRATIYMAVVLWSVAGLSLVRFIGAVWYLIARMFRGV